MGQTFGGKKKKKAQSDSDFDPDQEIQERQRSRSPAKSHHRSRPNEGRGRGRPPANFQKKSHKRAASSSDEDSDDDQRKRRREVMTHILKMTTAQMIPDQPRKRKVAEQNAVVEVGYMQEMRLSEELAAVVGIRRAPRHEVVKRMWKYIKANNLQWAKNKQWIKCDDALFKIIGQKKFRGFGMTKYLKEHME